MDLDRHRRVALPYGPWRALRGHLAAAPAGHTPLGAATRKVRCPPCGRTIDIEFTIEELAALLAYPPDMATEGNDLAYAYALLEAA